MTNEDFFPNQHGKLLEVILSESRATGMLLDEGTVLVKEFRYDECLFFQLQDSVIYVGSTMLFQIMAGSTIYKDGHRPDDAVDICFSGDVRLPTLEELEWYNSTETT